MLHFGPVVMLEWVHVCVLARASTLTVMLIKPKIYFKPFQVVGLQMLLWSCSEGQQIPPRNGWGRAEVEGGTSSWLDVFNTAIAG